MHWVTGGERWRAWLVDYNAAGPGDNLRLESARSPRGRGALGERSAEIVSDRRIIDC